MGDVSVQSGATIVPFFGSILVQSSTAFTAEAGSQMILGGAAWTPICEFAAWHRHKRTPCPLNDLQIANHEAMIECDRTERLQAIVGIIH
jgi:hypothetical protein